jgi:hypothetical protein
MRKQLVLLACFVLIQVELCISQRTEESVIKEGSSLYGVVDKKITYFSESNTIEKIELYLNENVSLKNGFYKQVVNYKDGKENSYEMFQNNNTISNTGLIKRVEYVDDEDKVFKIELVFENNVKYELVQEQVDLVEKYPIYTLAYYENVFKETEPQEGIFSIEAPIYSGMSSIIFTSEKKETTEKEIELIQGWQKAHKFEDYSKLFTYKVKVKENDSLYYMHIQESLIEGLIENDNVLVRYYYIGGYGIEPMYLITGYMEQ